MGMVKPPLQIQLMYFKLIFSFIPFILPLDSSGGSHVAITAVPFPRSGLTSKFSGGPDGASKRREYMPMKRQ